VKKKKGEESKRIIFRFFLRRGGGKEATQSRRMQRAALKKKKGEKRVPDCHRGPKAERSFVTFTAARREKGEREKLDALIADWNSSQKKGRGD